MRGNQLWSISWGQKINTYFSVMSVSKHGQLNWIHKVFSKGLLWMVNTRGYKNATLQQIFKAVAEALKNSSCLLPASWVGAWERNNIEVPKCVGHCLVGFLLNTVSIRMLEIPWTEAYTAEWLPGSSACLRLTTRTVVGVSSYSLKGANSSPWQGHCPHLCIWGEISHRNIFLGPGQTSLV